MKKKKQFRLIEKGIVIGDEELFMLYNLRAICNNRATLVFRRLCLSNEMMPVKWTSLGQVVSLLLVKLGTDYSTKKGLRSPRGNRRRIAFASFILQNEIKTKNRNRVVYFRNRLSLPLPLYLIFISTKMSLRLVYFPFSAFFFLLFASYDLFIRRASF